MNGQLISITTSDKSVMTSLVKRMQIHMCLQVLAIYGQVAVKCHLLSHVVFEMAGCESIFNELC